MFKKQVVALALLAVVGTSGASFAAESRSDSTYAARHRHHVVTQDDRGAQIVTQDAKGAEIERFFNGNPPEGWPYSPQ